MPIITRKGCFSITTLNVYVKPAQFYSSKILMKSKNSGFCYYYSFWPFFLGFAGAFFFFPPSFFFYYSNRFYSSFFFAKYYSNYLSFYSLFYFSFRLHLINTFFPSRGYSFTVFILYRKRSYSFKENVDLSKNWLALMN